MRFEVQSILFITLFCISMSQLTGAAVPHPVDKSIMKMAKQFRSEVEARANTQYSVYEPVEALSQVVAGMVYFVKIDVGKEKAVWIKIYDHFGDKSLLSIRKDVRLSEPIVYF